MLAIYVQSTFQQQKEWNSSKVVNNSKKTKEVKGKEIADSLISFNDQQYITWAI